MSPTLASGQDYTFGDWARDQGYSPGDVMPEDVRAGGDGIDSLEGIGDFDWTTTPTETLRLGRNQISSIESGTFSGLTNLTLLLLGSNQLSSIESGDFSGLTNLTELELDYNQISSIESETFSGLTNLDGLILASNQISSIESGAFSELTNLTELRLGFNRISSIESGDFGGLTNLLDLELYHNWISSIESGAFSGFTSLRSLFLGGNIALTELNLDEAALSSLSEFGVGNEMVGANVNIASVSLKNAVLGWHSLVILLDGDGPDLMKPFVGIGELDGITKMDLSGIDFASITNLGPLYVMDDLTDLWFVNTQNVDATALDALLDNLETIEGTDTEGILYMTQANFDAFNVAGGGLLAAWNAEQGHHVAFVIPEPSTLLLCIVALGVVGGWRRRGG
jgi:hypothetical protein